MSVPVIITRFSIGSSTLEEATDRRTRDDFLRLFFETRLISKLQLRNRPDEKPAVGKPAAAALIQQTEKFRHPDLPPAAKPPEIFPNHGSFKEIAVAGRRMTARNAFVNAFHQTGNNCHRQ